jgi:hypothetical protein
VVYVESDTEEKKLELGQQIPSSDLLAASTTVLIYPTGKGKVQIFNNDGNKNSIYEDVQSTAHSGTHATMQFRILCLLISYLKTQGLK